MKMFYGTYKIMLDDKNRMRIPNKLRASLGEKFYIINGNGECLFVFDQAEFDKLNEKLDKVPLSDTEAQRSVRNILASVVDPEEDGQSRFILPAFSREYASIKKKVVFIGVKNRIEIWAEEVYDANNNAQTKGETQKSFERLKNYEI